MGGITGIKNALTDQTGFKAPPRLHSEIFQIASPTTIWLLVVIRV